MNWRGFLTEAFNKPSSRNIRLVLSLLFIALATIIIMILFQVAKVFLDPNVTLWESHIYTIIFTGLVAPTVALFVLLRFEGLYAKISEENEERKQAEKALRKSEAMLNQIIDTSPIPMVIYREEKNYHINKKFIDAFGYTKDDIPSIDEWWPLAYPDKAYCEFVKNRWYAAVNDAVQNKTSIAPQEVIVTCKDGSKKDVSVFLSSIGDMNLAILQDITERKQAEESLKFERLQLLSIFDSIDEVVYVADPYTYEILYANKAMQDKFGKSLTGGICYRGIQDKDAPCEFCTNDIILRNKGEPYRWEFHNPTVNKDFEIVDRIIKWPDGRDVRFEIALDITERKRAENALLESEEKYRELVENANSIILRWDMQGNLTFFNEFAEILLGYSKNEILGRNIMGTIVPLSESTGRDMAEMIEEVKRYPERYKLNVNENICKNGDRVWIAWTNKAVHDEHGNVVEILSVGNDITEHKQADEDLKVAKAQAELYVDLMGHDINNIHQVALGYLELARDMPCDAREECLDKATEALQRSTRLINNVRKLQKFQDNRVQAYDVDVCEVLAGVHEEFATTPGKTVTLNMNGCTHCHVRADDLLHDVFSNLVGNAVKHTGDHTYVSISIDMIREDSMEYCRVRVEDDGPGISDESKKTLFNRSLKGTPRAKGMGLGLYIVKTLVENYGGRVWAENRVIDDHTKGARFVVMLPAVEK